jgi:hypothetical protein
MKINHISSLIAVGLAAVSTTSSLQADDILIYKATSARSWTAYAADNPQSTNTATPAVAKTPLVGKYNYTEWWIVNRTSRTLQRINYFTVPYVEGAKEKSYIVYGVEEIGDAAVNLGATNDGSPITQMILKDKKANSFKYMFNEFFDYFADDFDIDGDSNDDIETEYVHQTLTGSAKKLVITPTVMIDKVPSTISGPWLNTLDTKFLNGSGDIAFQKQLFEKGKTTVKLDTKKTKSVMTGPAPITSYRGGLPVAFATQAYAVALIENELYKLGYDYQQ